MRVIRLRLLTPLALAAAILGLVLSSAGCSEVATLRRRVDVEVKAFWPHPEFVPTPLPYVDLAPQTALAEALTATLPALVPVLPDLDSAPTVQPDGVATPTAAPALTPIATLLPQRPIVPTITPAPTRRPTRPAGEPPFAVQLAGVTHMWQTWNNCGPATLAMYLSYFGQRVKQDEIGAALRPDPDDKNVSLEEMAAYARNRGLSAVVRVNGDARRLQRLIAAGVPVLIETWHEERPNDGMGHYRLLTGYDDDAGHWIAYDSFDARGLVKGEPYTGIRLPYDETERLWAVFNRLYLVLYDAAHAPAVLLILSEDADEAVMWSRALARSQAEVQLRPDDPFAWFNLGSNLVALGRFREAVQAYDRARRIGLPWRMLWYQFGPFQAYYEIGRYDDVIALAEHTIATARQTEEGFYWRGMAQRARGDLVGARASWQRAVELNPHYKPAVTALAQLDGH